MLLQFIKFNWKLKILTGSFCYNAGLFYYQHSVQGHIEFPIVDFCTANSHIYVGKTHIYNHGIFIPCLESLLLTGCLGGFGMIISTYSLFDNANSNYRINSINDSCCECGWVKK